MKVLYFAPTSTLYGDNIALLNILKILVSDYNVIPYIITSREGEFTERLKELGYCYSTMNFGQVMWPPVCNIRDFILLIPRLVKYLLWYNSPIYLWLCLNRIIREFQPNLIHTNNSCVYTGLLVAKLWKIKHIQHIREYTEYSYRRPYFPTRNRFLNLIASNWNKNIFITCGVMSLWNQVESIRNKVIYDGVYSQNIKFRNKEKDNYFLYVGRLVKDKGVLELLEEFNLFCQNNDTINLKIVGDGPLEYKHQLCHFVSNRNLANRVEFLGYQKDTFTLMARAMAVIVPSYFEGFGFVPVEAMINGALVVLRDTTGLKEQLDRGVSTTGVEIGLRFKENRDMSIIMNEIVKNGMEYYSSMISHAQLAIKAYSSEESAKEVFNYYNEVV